MSLKGKALKIVGEISKGKVSTYGRIAKAVGLKSARPVGNWLHTHNQLIRVVPCHRVVNSQGKLAKNFGAKGSLDKYLWKGK